MNDIQHIEESYQHAVILEEKEGVEKKLESTVSEKKTYYKKLALVGPLTLMTAGIFEYSVLNFLTLNKSSDTAETLLTCLGVFGGFAALAVEFGSIFIYSGNSGLAAGKEKELKKEKNTLEEKLK